MHRVAEPKALVSSVANAVDVTWVCADFAELTVRQLYDVLELRQRVFVLEQDCLFPDIDGDDQNLCHLMAYDGDSLVAYSRFGAGTIGRVIIAKSHRGRGMSYDLMLRSIEAVRSRYGPLPITIGAQAHLQGLYKRIGFVPSSEEYDEDGIMHIDMILESS